MSDRLRELLKVWALREGDSEEIFLGHAEVQYLSRRVYDDYEPSQYERFEERLDRWLHNMESDEDRQTLFRLLNRLFFIGRPEFESLCRAAFHGPVLRWLVDQLEVSIADFGAMGQLSAGIDQTWFCAITDSMRINSFFKVNGLVEKSHEPDWRSLRKFGDAAKILGYIRANDIRRIVLLEDFVGSGTQMESAVQFASTISPDIEILACPLVTCPAGYAMGKALALNCANVAYEPVMEIAGAMLIKADAQPGEPQLFGLVRALIAKTRARLGPPQELDTETQKYHGFKNTGAVVAMYSNCPNNSLPILWDQTEKWDALFPRIMRQ
jgi:hypothetical protein